MTLVRFQEPRTRRNELLNNCFMPETYFRQQYFNQPPANITEDDTSFYIELAVPGFQKDDFSILFEKQLLTISLDKENEEQNEQQLRMREFQFNPFKRSFRIGKQINTEAITAAYNNGLLKITLPKQETFIDKPARNINIEG